MTKLQDLYTGCSGQSAVMSEFLIRGYNVAVPEVDIGDDLFVVHDIAGSFWRVQVKTANGKHLKLGGYSAQFSLRRDQLSTPITPDLIYIFAVRVDEKWASFLVLPRDKLNTLHELNGVGSLYKTKVTFRFSYRNDTVTSCKQDLTCFLGDFSKWPTISN